MLLAALNFSFEATSGLTPLLEELLSFFITTFISQLLVLGIEPHLLQLLLGGLTGWVIVLVV
jgi:hypothetical protein